MVRVVLADDEEFVRYFLKTVMAQLSFEVVAEVETGDEVYSVLEETQPDILLLDVNMPNLTGMEFLKQHASDFPDTCIIILTSATSAKIMADASIGGARCFLRKDTPIDKMMSSIKETWITFKEEMGIEDV